ncbi:MAG: hypothetical protein M1548_01555 [Actinobacteria bacterium]|nr:hypothetical protein [Actinomycetota bacterium]
MVQKLTDARRNLNDRLPNPELLFVILLLLIGLTRGIIYASVIPLGQAPDEPAHYMYVEELTKRMLPSTETDALYVPKSHISGRPPLYYVSLVPTYRFSSGLSLRVRFYLLRYFSVLYYVLLILLSYLLAKRIFPRNKAITLGAPAFVAFNPMLAHILSSVNAESLAAVVFTLFLIFTVDTINNGFNLRNVALVVFAVVLGLLTRATLLAAYPALILLVLAVLFRTPSQNNRHLMRRAFLGILIVVSTALAFYLALKSPIIRPAALQVAYIDAVPLLISKGFSTYQSGFVFAWHSFWGVFGAVFDIAALDYFSSLTWVTVLALVGVVFWLLKNLAPGKLEQHRRQLLAVLFLSPIPLMLFLPPVFRWIVLGGSQPPQGRYAFPAIAVFAILLSLGLSQLFPKKLKNLTISLIGAGFFIFDRYSLLNLIIPRYYGAAGLLDHVIPTMTWHENLRLSPRGLLALADKPFPLNTSDFYTIVFGLYWVLFALFLLFTLYLLTLDFVLKPAFKSPRGYFRSVREKLSLELDKPLIPFTSDEEQNEVLDKRALLMSFGFGSVALAMSGALFELLRFYFLGAPVRPFVFQLMDAFLVIGVVLVLVARKLSKKS